MKNDKNNVLELKKKTKKKNMIKLILRNKFRYVLILPAMIYFVIYKYVPMYGIIIAFKDYSPAIGIFDSEWIGLRHFKTLFRYGDFERAFTNTLIISLYRIILGYILTLLLALMINELANGVFRKVIQTITYLPHFLSWIVVYGLFLVLLGPDGSITNLARDNGLPVLELLTDPNVFRGTLVGTSIWKGVGWGTIIYLAALAGVDPGMYEAAKIDGCSRIKRIWYISLPSIMPVVVITVILSMGTLMGENLQQILQFQNNLVISVSDVFETVVYRKGLSQMNYGYGTAVGLFQSSAAVVLTLISNKIAKKMGHEGLW